MTESGMQENDVMAHDHLEAAATVEAAPEAIALKAESEVADSASLARAEEVARRAAPADLAT
jgi:hypothetical protein